MDSYQVVEKMNKYIITRTSSWIIQTLRDLCIINCSTAPCCTELRIASAAWEFVVLEWIDRVMLHTHHITAHMPLPTLACQPLVGRKVKPPYVIASPTLCPAAPAMQIAAWYNFKTRSCPVVEVINKLQAGNSVLEDSNRARYYYYTAFRSAFDWRKK